MLNASTGVATHAVMATLLLTTCCRADRIPIDGALAFNLSGTPNVGVDVSSGRYVPLDIYREGGGYGVAFLLPPVPLLQPLGGGPNNGFFMNTLTTAFGAGSGWRFSAAANSLGANTLQINADQVAGGSHNPCFLNPARDCVGIYGPPAPPPPRVGPPAPGVVGFVVTETNPAANGHWLQVLGTNSPAAGRTSPYVDNAGSTTNPYYPGTATSSIFMDSPQRDPTQSQYWIADLYYASGGNAKGAAANPTQVTIYDGMMWGWADLFVPGNWLNFMGIVNNDFRNLTNLDSALGTDLTSVLSQSTLNQLDSEFNAAVPEPSTTVPLVVIGVALLACGRSRRGRKAQTQLLAGLFLVGFLLIVPATATQINAAGAADFSASNVPNSGTGTQIVFAVSVAPPAAPVVNGVTTAWLNNPATPLAVAATTRQTTYFWPARGKYGSDKCPGAGDCPVASSTAKAAGDRLHMDTVSNAGFIGAAAAVSNGAAGESVLNANTVQLTAGSSFTTNREAFGRAIDPLFFSSGPNTFSATLPAGLMLSSDDPLGIAGAEAYMTVPRADFPGEGGNCSILLADTQDCALFAISVFAKGVIRSPTDLTISVQVDPITKLNASALESSLAGDLSASAPNTVTLAHDFTVPSFTLDFGSSYSVETVFDTGVNTVPEPSTASLLIAAIGIAGLARRRVAHR